MDNTTSGTVPNGLRGLWHRHVQTRFALLHATGWVTLTYGVQQLLRLGTNIVLAWLLAPELLGVMLLINTLRTGGELLTDVGVGQSIVNNKQGDTPLFYNTAWTIQIIRGLILFALAMAFTIPIANAYDKPELLILLPAAAPIFLITGVMSPSRFLLQKHMKVRKLALFDLGAAIFGTAVQIGLAIYTPTIWALIWGLLIGAVGPVIASFFLIDWRSHRLCWDKKAVREILHFGKWIFLASLVYFLAMNFDRLYLADAIPFALLGVYGIARTYADTVMLLFQRMGNLLIFPKVSASEQNNAALRQSIRPVRMAALLAVAGGLALGIALADLFIDLVYDDRYQAAGIFLPILLLATWFGILATMADAMIMGMGKPSGVAFGNGAKLLVIVLALPFVLPRFGLAAALGIFVLAEMMRYGILIWRKRSMGLSFVRQDVAMTMIFIILVLAFRAFTGLMGWTGGIEQWITETGVLHG